MAVFVNWEVVFQPLVKQLSIPINFSPLEGEIKFHLAIFSWPVRIFIPFSPPLVSFIESQLV